MLLPWQQQAWHNIFTAPGTFAQVLLVSGPEGIGKLQFARMVAQALLCEQPSPDQNPCGVCASCRWYRQDTHPDFKLLQPGALATDEGYGSQDPGSNKTKQAGKQISVTQVRELAAFMELTAHRGGRKVVLLHPAEDLNVNAANALLKTLEEPPPETIFLLVSHRPHGIPATVRSRCRRLPMPVPTVALGAAWLAEQGVEDPLFVLAEAGNAPLRAMENARGRHFERRKSFLERLANGTLDPIRDAATHDSTELPEVLGWLHKWTYDLVANRLTGRARYNPDYADSLQRISRQANVVQLGRYYRTLVSYRSRLGHPLSSRLVLEHLFFLYLRCLDRRK